MKRWTPIRIEWTDAVRVEEGWHQPRSHETEGCVTVGMLVEETKKAVTVALSRDPVSGDVCSTITIPRNAIAEMRELR